MKFHIPSFQALIKVPKEVEPMWNAFGTLVETIKTAFSNGISLEENIEHYLITTRVLHGMSTDVQHNLKRTPRAIIPIGGRVEFCEILAKDSKSFRIRAKLYSATATSLALNTYTDRLDTRAPFLSKGDGLSVNGASVTVVRVGKESITLDKPVMGKSSLEVHLLSETISFLIL